MRRVRDRVQSYYVHRVVSALSVQRLSPSRQLVVVGRVRSVLLDVQRSTSASTRGGGDKTYGTVVPLRVRVPPQLSAAEGTHRWPAGGCWKSWDGCAAAAGGALIAYQTAAANYGRPRYASRCGRSPRAQQSRTGPLSPRGARSVGADAFPPGVRRIRARCSPAARPARRACRWRRQGRTVAGVRRGDRSTGAGDRRLAIRAGPGARRQRASDEPPSIQGRKEVPIRPPLAHARNRPRRRAGAVVRGLPTSGDAGSSPGTSAPAPGGTPRVGGVPRVASPRFDVDHGGREGPPLIRRIEMRRFTPPLSVLVLPSRNRRPRVPRRPASRSEVPTRPAAASVALFARSPPASNRNGGTRHG
jgi:hypothetical protein